MRPEKLKYEFRFLVPMLVTGAVLAGCSPTTNSGQSSTGEVGTFTNGKYNAPPPRFVGSGMGGGR
jgi:hypothetical protein